jgi:glycosyltransferase involved in cell wall biosynthesis
VAKAELGVVVPTLNSAATLDWTLCSLHNQRDASVRIIVADSGSQDQTLDICKRWAVETVYVPPGNMYRAINEGVRRLETEWVTYLNSDDFVYPMSYRRLIAQGDQEQAALSYGDNDVIDYEGRFLFALRAASPARLQRLLCHGRLAITQAAAIYRSVDCMELGGFNEQYRHVADLDFFYRFAMAGKKLTKVSGPAVAAFRRHSSQLSSRESSVTDRETMSFLATNNITLSPVACVDLVCWRAQNLPEYAWRVLRHGDSKWITTAVAGAKKLAHSSEA